MAAVFASANVVGGYVVTERMLKMFRRRAPEGDAAALNGQRGLRGLLARAGAGKNEPGDGA